MTVEAPQVPALIKGRVKHSRLAPKKHAFGYRHSHWLIDVDDVPSYRWPLSTLARFRVQDHLDRGRLGGGLRDDLERFLANRDFTLEPNDRVLLQCHARMWGYIFNPMSAYWIIAPDSTLRAIVVEVHNTYGDRHAYLVDPSTAGRADVDKTFYVSPFNNMKGMYRMAFTMTPEQVAITINLDRDGERIINTSVIGKPRPANRRRILGTFLTHGLMPQRATFLIRVHGIWLWLKRLPTQFRPEHPPEAVQ